MPSVRIRYLTFVVIALVFLSSVGAQALLNTDMGNVKCRSVFILDNGLEISGLMYIPAGASAGSPRPGIVLAHGIGTAKEMMGGIAFEAARRGFVALTIDEFGHGDSDGLVGGPGDATLGVLAAVRFLEAQAFVNRSAIALVGHSMGAGAVRATLAAQGNISASVLIAGGLGSAVSGQTYGEFNSSFPRNLMVVIGKYDVLFNLTEVENEELPPIFGASGPVAADVLYGNFSSGTSRKLIAPATTHLFEPFDPTVVSAILMWVTESLGSAGSGSSQPISDSNLVYPYVQGTSLLAVAAFVGLALSLSRLMDSLGSRGKKKMRGTLGDSKILLIWGGLGLGLFFPVAFAGFAIPFPPLLFGSSIAWWLFAVAVCGLFFLKYCAPRFLGLKVSLKEVLRESFKPKDLITAVILFATLYGVVLLVQTLLVVDLQILVPLFKVLTLSRALVFPSFLPFFLVYFFVEGLYIHELRQAPSAKDLRNELFDAGKIVFIRIAPYLLLLFFDYAPMIFAGIRLLPTLAGFLVEFIWGIIPTFVISTVCSWWFYRRNSTVGTGVIFNSLLFAWTAAGIFPFGSF